MEQIINHIPLNTPLYPINQIASVNINQITQDINNSILKIKINKNLHSDFIIINSNLTINYLSIDANTYNIVNLGTYNEHTAKINDVCFFTNTNVPFNKSFISCDKEGNILIWDSRANKSTYKIVKQIDDDSCEGVFCLDTNPQYLVAGYGKEISIWDLSNLKEVGNANYAHSEMVTSVKFYDNYLISSGDDFIINIFRLNINNIDNILDEDSVEYIINFQQSIIELYPLETDYISAITSINSFAVISLNNCSTMYEFDAKNKNYFSDYILNMNYDINNHIAQIYCGSNNGFISTICFNLTKKEVKPILNGVFYSGYEQTFNSLSLINNNTFITVSDKGLIYVFQQNFQNSYTLNDYFNKIGLNYQIIKEMWIKKSGINDIKEQEDDNEDMIYEDNNNNDNIDDNNNNNNNNNNNDNNIDDIDIIDNNDIE